MVQSLGSCTLALHNAVYELRKTSDFSDSSGLSENLLCQWLQVCGIQPQHRALCTGILSRCSLHILLVFIVVIVNVTKSFNKGILSLGSHEVCKLCS